MTRILVLGASGYVGGHLAPRLAAAGHDVRTAARRVDALRARGWDGVECVRADALELDSLEEALDGVEIAYYLVHSMAAGQEFSELDRRAATNFRDAAASAGVQRIIYLGGLQPPV
ncbi:MAG: NAD(P)H-binding protein, partial [Chloroflexi bacterium]|nr:NAD(P)H-binding protein [Chloroflexota bacterium]